MLDKAVAEKKAIAHLKAKNYGAAAEIYYQLASLDMNIDNVCSYMNAAIHADDKKGVLAMVGKYVDAFGLQISPKHKNFYMLAVAMSFHFRLYEEALSFALHAEKCGGDTDDGVFLLRSICETYLGSSEGVREEETRLLNVINQFCKGEFGDENLLPPLMVATWFDDNELLYRVTKRSAAGLNKIKPFEHTPTLDDMLKPKLKIGYYSCHVRNHPAMNISCDYFKTYNSDRFETHGFFHGADYSYDKAKLFAESFDGYSDIDDMTDFEAAQYIKDMGIDILVDLSSMVEGARSAIIAHKPAPIIMHYQGYMGTTCIDAIDYKITDIYTNPPEEMEHYSEKFAYLPEMGYKRRLKKITDKSLQDRSRWGLPEDAFVFANMCAPYKYTPEIIKAWMTILGNVEDSVLWLSNPPSDSTKDMFYFYADKTGIDKNRIIFDKERLDYDSHLSRLPCMDMHLDTRIFCGHSTTVDMIEMGVFPLCMQGRHFNSQFSSSVFKHLGCTDMVAKDIDEYIKTAVVLGRNKELAKTWSNHVYEQATKAGLFKPEEIIQDLENVYEMAYTRWLTGLGPDHFMAEPVSQDDTIALENMDYVAKQEDHTPISEYR